MTIHRRIVRAEGVDLGASTFQMTLATEGEASDGHILSIEGGRIPERMPLLVSHMNDPSSQAGSVIRPRKVLRETPRRLKATGHIETGGEDPAAGIRRDLLHMIDRGHVNAVSIRWDADPKDAIPRTALPADHPFYVDGAKEPAESPRRWGLFFRRWRAMEGSIVAVGADPGALIGRADETSGEARTFWRAMADEAAEHEEAHNASLSLLLDRVRWSVSRARESGATLSDCLNAVADLDEEGLESLDVVPVEIGTTRIFLPEPLAEAYRAQHCDGSLEDSEPRAEAGPAEAAAHDGSEEPERVASVREIQPVFDPKSVVSEIREIIAQRDADMRRTMREIIDSATGKVRR